MHLYLLIYFIKVILKERRNQTVRPEAKAEKYVKFLRLIHP